MQRHPSRSSLGAVAADVRRDVRRPGRLLNPRDRAPAVPFRADVSRHARHPETAPPSRTRANVQVRSTLAAPTSWTPVDAAGSSPPSCAATPTHGSSARSLLGLTSAPPRCRTTCAVPRPWDSGADGSGQVRLTWTVAIPTGRTNRSSPSRGWGPKNSSVPTPRPVRARSPRCRTPSIGSRPRHPRRRAVRRGSSTGRAGPRAPWCPCGTRRHPSRPPPGWRRWR